MEMPSFLQSKQVTTPDYSNDRKKKFGIIVLAVLLFAIPLTVWLAQRAQIFNPSAAGGPIELVSGGDSCVISTDPNKVSCASFPIKLTSTLGPPVPMSCISDSQCSAGNKCFNHQNYPGTCRPADTVCAQVVTRACFVPPSCNPSDSTCMQAEPACGDFPTPCHVPPGWVVDNGSRSPSPSPHNEPTPSPSPSASVAACTTNAINLSSAVISNNQISYTLNYPANSKITQVNLPATPGFAFSVGTQSAGSGQALNANLGTGFESVVITVTGDANKACNPYTISYTMVNQCGQTISRFLGPGSASAYGSVCTASPSPTVNEPGPSVSPSKTPSPAGSTTGVSSGTDQLGVNLQSQGTCSGGFPIVRFSNSGRPNTGNFKLFRNGSPLSYFFASSFSRPPTTQMTDSGLNLNTQYSYYIEVIDGQGLGLRSNTTTVSTPSTCPTQGFNILQRLFEGFGKVKEAHAQSNIGIPDSAACVASGLGLANPVTAAGTSGSTLVYWNQSVGRDAFIAKVQECGASLLKPGNFQDASVKNLVQGVTGAPASSSDNSKYRNLIVEGPCSTAKLGAYETAGHTMLTDNQCDEPGIDYKVNQYYGPGSGANPFGVFSGIADGGANGYPLVVAASSNTASPSPSSSTTSPTPIPSGPGTVSFKVADTEAGLASAQTQPYTTHGQIYNFAFSNANPGVKQIWVEFIGADGSTNRQHISVEVVEPDPQLTSVDCSLDISGQNLRVTLNGARLGTGAGKVAVDDEDAQITTWGANQVIATIKPEGNLDSGKLFKVVLTKADSKILPEVSCQVGTTLVSLGARLFCREPGKFDINGVKVTLVDENGNKVEEEVTVDSAGIIKNLKTKLQVGKLYVISVKAPYSLRKNAQFTAANGTNVISPADGQPFILPVGDIAPVILQDGKINALDYAEIIRQWSVLGSGSKTGDFNRDTKVNSIDWACMRYDFNKEDEAIPARATPTLPSPVPSFAPSINPNPTTGASATPQASVGTSPSPVPSSSRTAFFLLQPVAGGTYILDDEFIVDLKVSSEVEAANLFSAKLSFDPQALEVSRIERGTALTSWVEEVFNNQAGTMSLTAGVPNPGLKTTANNYPTMARIIFKSKEVGQTDINVTSASQIFSNATNTNILNNPVSQAVQITAQ